MNLSPVEKELLKALRRNGNFKNNPGNPRDLLVADWKEADAAARRLREAGLVKHTPDSSQPGAFLVRLTDGGRAEADILVESSRKPTFSERVKAIPVGKGLWDIIKILIGAAIGWAMKSITG
jgi:hypothetical protein